MGAAGTAAPIAGGAAEAYTIGRPRRSEHPVYVPSLRAAVFGDAVVGAEGGLRFWTLRAGPARTGTGTSSRRASGSWPNGRSSTSSSRTDRR